MIERDVTYKDRSNKSRRICSVNNIKANLKEFPNERHIEGTTCLLFDEFVHEATKHIPDAKFCRDNMHRNGEEYQVIVYCDDDYTEMGRLIATYYDDNIEYCVQSHKIENNRYCYHNSSDEHHTLSSKHLKKAVANARRYLRPNRMADVGKCTHYKVSSEVMGARSKIKDNRANRAFELGFDVGRFGRVPEIAQKVVDMYRMGLMRLEPELAARMDGMLEAMEAHDAMPSDDEEFMTCVWIKPNEVQLHAFDVHYRHSSQPTRVGRGQDPYDPSFGCYPTVVPSNNLTEDVQGKVALLSMLEDGEFMYDVGVKISDSVYYIRSDGSWADY